MKEVYAKSDSGNLKEALRGITSPDALIMISNGKQFEQHVKELQEAFPNVPSIAGTGYFYGKTVREGGVGIIALSGVKAVAGVMTHASDMPIHDVGTLQKNVSAVSANSNDTVCIDICTGNDACVLTSMDSVLGKNRISLIGGTSMDPFVAANGVVYNDAAAYILVKNQGGRVRVYKENLYRPLDDTTFIASKTDRSKYYIGELNGKPAKEVYKSHLGISESDIATQTFQNPFGKMTGRDICIISLKEVVGNGLACYRQVNDSDVLCLLDMGDFREITSETIHNIKSDFSRVSGVISVNCVFRYIVFNNNHYMDEYLTAMSTIGTSAGFFANGEHHNGQFVNQSMSCVVFE
ncbi:MAG: FIST C-terminal domain-containing protein [Lachnospiraceae bacterium]|nr:FIST C-terminal domain-containing protein [Lachnospiraceae bacterium]